MPRRLVPTPRTIGQRELVVMVAFLMSLQAFTIDGMLPALSDMASELGASVKMRGAPWQVHRAPTLGTARPDRGGGSAGGDRAPLSPERFGEPKITSGRWRHL